MHARLDWIIMAVLDGLFSRGMREILETRIGSYPLYVYCFNDILNKGLFARLESGKLSSYDRGDSGKVIGRVSARKIRPYLRSLFKGRPYTGKVDILFVSRYRPLNIAGAKRLMADYLFSPVIDELCKKGPELRMALVTVGGHGKHYVDDRVESFSLFESLSLRLLLESMFRSLLLYSRYKRMAGRLSVIQKKMFDGFFSLRNLLFCHLLDSCLGKVIHDLDPEAIVANDDVMVFKPRTDTDTRLIVLQSALIAEQNEKYRNMLFSDFLEDGLLSDCFCVSGPQGESTKQEFLKDTKKIVVTGQPRFDNLARAEKLFDGGAIRTKFGLTLDDKILLWTTESGLSLEESAKNVSAVYDAVNSLGNIRLVIKLHPAEDQEAPVYRKNSTYTPLIVKGNQDLSELLYICDLMMTKSSTTVLEAAILGKPVIVLNLSGKPDVIPYVEKGVAVGVYREEDLASAIQNVLYDTEVRERLSKEQSKFAYENTYVQDGKASERVAELILQMVEST
jgi:CDP-glycerol glycerophosphotransferase (TagB/SpsB family)